MEVVLDLYNFDSADAEGSKYVLTSPRSLEACSRLKVKPVELLHKSHGVFSQENVEKPVELIQILYKEWEEKRMALLQKCRQEREKIILEQQLVNKKEKKRNVCVNKSKNSQSRSDFSPQKAAKHLFNSSPSHANAHDLLHNSGKSSSCENSLLTVLETPNSQHKFVNKNDGLRSCSVENGFGQKNWKVSKTGSRSLSVFGNNSALSSGYITPQIQRDRRLVELMKERRREDAKEEKERRIKILSWSKEQKEIKQTKRKEEFLRQKELANSHLAWEKKLKEEESKKLMKLRSLEEEMLLKNEQSEIVSRNNIEKQERLRLHQIEDRKKIAQDRKQKQEKNLNKANAEIMAHQKAIEEDIKVKQEKASQMKAENEVKELQKVTLMNKNQRERMVEIQSELKRKQEMDEETKREALEKKLQKAAENYTKKVIKRDINMKNQGRIINERIDQTKNNLKRLDRQAEDHKQSIVVQKNKKTQKATNIAQETALSKAIRAKEIRTASEEEWRKNLHLIRKKDKELVEKMKESLVIKDDKLKRHNQLKEAALEFSRVQAKINEAERELIQRKSTNFHQMAQKAKLSADIGRGPRSSFVNYSTVKLG